MAELVASKYQVHTKSNSGDSITVNLQKGCKFYFREGIRFKSKTFESTEVTIDNITAMVTATAPIHNKFIYIFRTNKKVDGSKISLHVEAQGICPDVEKIYTDNNIEKFLLPKWFDYTNNTLRKKVLQARNDDAVKQGVLAEFGFKQLKNIKGKYQFYNPKRSDREKKNNKGKISIKDYIELDPVIQGEKVKYFICLSDYYLPAERIEDLKHHIYYNGIQKKRFIEISFSKQNAYWDISDTTIPLIDFHSQVKFNHYRFMQFRELIAMDVIKRQYNPEYHTVVDSIYRLMQRVADDRGTFNDYNDCLKDKELYTNLDFQYLRLLKCQRACKFYGGNLVNWLDSDGFRAVLYDSDFGGKSFKELGTQFIRYKKEIAAIEKGARFLKKEFDAYYSYDNELAKLGISQNILNHGLRKINYFSFGVEMGRKIGGDLVMEVAEMWPFVTAKLGQQKAADTVVKFLNTIFGERTKYSFKTVQVSSKNTTQYIVVLEEINIDSNRPTFKSIVKYGDIRKKMNKFGKIAGSLHLINGIIQFGNAIARGHVDKKQAVELTSTAVDCINWALQVKDFGKFSKVGTKFLGPIGAALDGTVAVFNAQQQFEKDNTNKALAYAFQALGCGIILIAGIVKAPLVAIAGLVMFIIGIIWSEFAHEESEEKIWLRHSNKGICSECPGASRLKTCSLSIRETSACKPDPEPYKEWTVYKKGRYHWPYSPEDHFVSLNKLLKIS